MQVAKAPDGSQASAVVQAAVAVFSQNVNAKQPFNLTLLNLGATSFSEGGRGRERAHPSIARLLRSGGGVPSPAAAIAAPVSPGADFCQPMPALRLCPAELW